MRTTLTRSRSVASPADETPAGARARESYSRKSRRRREALTGLAFVFPAVVLFAVFGGYPVGYGLLLSFARWNGISPSWQWVGLSNFTDLFVSDPTLTPTVRAATRVTIIVLAALPLSVLAISFPLAVLLNTIRRLRTFLRTLYFLPYVTTGIAVFYAWRFMYDPQGIINAILKAVGLGSLARPDGFLGNPSTALAACIVVLVWANVPLGVLLYLTGLQTIPDSVLEAAKTDGASTPRTLWSIVLPLLNPVTALIVVLELRQALENFQLFLLLTNGGPVDRTNTLGLQTYTFAFGDHPNLGLASALGWSVTGFAIVLAVVNFAVLRRRA